MKKRTQKEVAALEVLKGTGVDVLEAALLAKSVLEAGRGRVRRARACIAAGDAALRKNECTVSFARAVAAALEQRKHRRARTLRDFRYITRRFMARCKGLGRRRVRSISAAECAAYLQEAFETPPQRKKARLILSGVFSTAVKRGWCAENPVQHVEPERVEEKRIRILNREEIERLLAAAESYEGGVCLPAVGMMLYAGIRPHEVERLRWEDVQLPPGGAPCAEPKGRIYISPQHSKTGGARCVTIHAPLAHILQRVQKAEHERICPPNWQRRWAGLHKEASFAHWQADVLRHTFATHHLATFRNYAELQLEMGHRSAELLRTRYVAMEPAQSMFRASCQG